MRRVDFTEDLPRTPRVGDQIKLKDEKRAEYREACDKAGWTKVDLGKIRTVTREDNFNPGGGWRLWFDGPPFCFASPDVELAWNSAAERRKGLLKAGH